MNENNKKNCYPYFFSFLSPEVLCTQGIDHINSGIRIGDSGGALNLEENGRLMPCHLPLNFVFEVNKFIIFRFTVVGVSSYGVRGPPSPAPEVYARITPEIKNWIKQRAKNAQDSICSTTIITSTTTATSTPTTTTKGKA